MRTVGLYEDKDKYYFVMELITDGNLLKLLNKVDNQMRLFDSVKLRQSHEQNIRDIVK